MKIKMSNKILLGLGLVPVLITILAVLIIKIMPG
jgi:hypothetical protein